AFDDSPGGLGEPAGPPAGFEGLVAGRGAIHGPLHDPLQDARQAEHVVGDVEIPVFQHFLGIAADALAVHLHVLALGGYAERDMVQACDATELAGFDMPGHAVVGEVGERVAEGGKLPVEYRSEEHTSELQSRENLV